MSNINLSAHAIKRCIERFGVKEADARRFVNDRMRKAVLTYRQSDGSMIFSAEGMIIVTNAQKNAVLTVYPEPSTVFAPEINKAVDKVVKKATAKISGILRELYSQSAQINEDITVCYRKLATCRNPYDFNAQLSKLKSQRNELEKEIRSKVAEKNKLTASAQALKMR
ncbi:hypothetical protein [Paenilisteria rocourtiae]|uniref:Uncharacterized protein n=1 Tax=Listeria rocourtiae TaxID=647910 RepID=A0A4R6ZRQ3_9LIST|nr:hypothetical protein [Listeria rocourtiae]EUJ44426.1 hypothetical protein PROCOU_14023 [Listeria rocourtiae FSL F6-920]TDR55092.1 hypothetical protein DFP96_10118 [Listeria rocourtiae]